MKRLLGLGKNDSDKSEKSPDKNSVFAVFKSNTNRITPTSSVREASSISRVSDPGNLNVQTPSTACPSSSSGSARFDTTISNSGDSVHSGVSKTSVGPGGATPPVPKNNSVSISLRSIGGNSAPPSRSNSLIFDSAPSDSEASQANKGGTVNMRLLIVDDSPLNCKMITKQLVSLHYECVTSKDGDEAVVRMDKLINNEDDSFAPLFDCILMDYNMKRMNGPEATKIIRDMGYNGVIIGMTANAYDTDFQTENNYFIEMGADTIIPKPFNTTAFSTMLGGILFTSSYFLLAQ